MKITNQINPPTKSITNFTARIPKPTRNALTNVVREFVSEENKLSLAQSIAKKIYRWSALPIIAMGAGTAILNTAIIGYVIGIGVSEAAPIAGFAAFFGAGGTALLAKNCVSYNREILNAVPKLVEKLKAKGYKKEEIEFGIRKYLRKEGLLPNFSRLFTTKKEISKLAEGKNSCQ